jgi:excinuclease ABC subunit C
MNIKDFKKHKLPDKPGVYFFLGPSDRGKKNENILYIGKATSLKDRVGSYFSKDLIDTRGPMLVDMVFSAKKIKYQVTDSVLEALILEAEQIKKHQPKYNTKEKSDKSFNYVCITKEELPKVVIVRGRNVKHRVFDKIYGPYTSSTQLREALRLVRKIFPFLDDKSKNYLEFYRQINLVPDINDKKLYLQNIKNIKLFFSGSPRPGGARKKILGNLKKEMLVYAKAKEFEKASEIKRQIFALQHINDVALLRNENLKLKNFSGLLHPTGGTFPVQNSLVQDFRIEAYDIAHMGGKNMVGVMTVVEDGEPEKSEYKKFKIRTQENANDTGALKEVLERRFNHPEWRYPNLLVVDGALAQFNTATKVLKNLSLKIPVVGVVKDDKHKAKAFIGNEEIINENRAAILLANSESHRFAINYHKNIRTKNFLP